MKKFFLAFLLGTFCSFAASAQYSRYLIQLTDKKNTPYQLANPAAFLSAQSIQRRAKQQIALDSSDLPLSPVYLDSIASVPNITVLNFSKWLNQVLISTTDASSLARIDQFPFVKKSSPIALRAVKNSRDTVYEQINGAYTELHRERVGIETGSDHLTQTNNRKGEALNYGNSFDQIHIHHGEYLHDLGFTGRGMTIAVLDAGFRNYLTNPAFDSLLINQQVLGTYDYVNRKPSVNEEDAHGAYCLSIMAANEPGLMTGSAISAKYWLLKTEDPSSEYPVEEQNWVVAAEFADSAGADIISTSLGYDYFDDPVFNQDYQQRNGHSTLISIGANLAVAKGMIVTASAGNSGEATDESRYISCPADADSVLAIGAINTSGQIAPFSSWGPNSAGMIKPGVVSVGQGTTIAAFNGQPQMGDGTSFSNPNLAGLIACLWQAYPEFSSHAIIEAVEKSADRFASPDDRYGYGIPDFQKAYKMLGDQRAFLNYIHQPGIPWISTYPVPFGDQFTVVFKPTATGTANLQLIDVNGRILQTRKVPIVANQYSMIQFNVSGKLAKGTYLIRYNDGQEQKTLKTIRQ